MKPDRSKITTKALTVLLALALMTGAFTACSNGSGTGRNGGSGTYKAYVLNNADGIVSFVKEHFLESK